MQIVLAKDDSLVFTTFFFLLEIAHIRVEVSFEQQLIGFILSFNRSDILQM